MLDTSTNYKHILKAEDVFYFQDNFVSVLFILKASLQMKNPIAEMKIVPRNKRK